jgi:hypothetical protein
MGMGNAPCHAWIISLEGLKAICPEAVEAFEAILTERDFTWDSFARDLELEEVPDDLLAHWETLQRAFEAATTVNGSHLELDIGFYDSEKGDLYDELESGCYFTVDGVTQLTEAGRKFKEHLTEQSWTVFG